RRDCAHKRQQSRRIEGYLALNGRALASVYKVPFSVVSTLKANCCARHERCRVICSATGRMRRKRSNKLGDSKIGSGRDAGPVRPASNLTDTPGIYGPIRAVKIELDIAISHTTLEHGLNQRDFFVGYAPFARHRQLPSA